MKRIDIIDRLLEKGYEAEERDYMKNGVLYEGIIIRDENPVVPVIYTEKLIKEAERFGKSLDEVAMEVVHIYEQHKHTDINIHKIMNKDFMFQHLYIGIQKESDEDLIKRKSEFEGLELYLYIREDQECFSIKVTDRLLDKVGITKSDAWAKAEKHTKSETTVDTLSNVMARICNLPSEDHIDDLLPIYVISNQIGTKGASCIINKEALRKIGKKHESSKLIILPASIHEMLVVPSSYGLDINDLSATVFQVNEEEVQPEDRLTDRAYVVEV